MMKIGFFSLASALCVILVVPAMAKKELIIESLPLDSYSKKSSKNKSKRSQQVEKWVTSSGGLQEKEVTRRFYLQAILHGAEYGNYVPVALLEEAYVKDFYQKRKYKTVWFSAGFTINPMTFSLLEFLRDVSEEGLNPEKYHLFEIDTILDEIKNDDTISKRNRNLALAQVDILLSDAFLAVAKDLREGEIDFGAFEAYLYEKNEAEETTLKWEKPRMRADYVDFLEWVLQKKNLKESLLSLVTTNELYHLFKEAHIRYAKIADEGGWKKIPYGKRLRLGTRSKYRVPLLAKRLHMTGDLDTFDANVTRVNGEIQAALKHYQKRMGLWESGTLNEITRKTLNVSVKRRLSQIKLNMERSRWERRPFGSDYVWINIPEYRMKLIRDGLADIDMRVVVGKVSNPTPIFTSKFSYVVVNPTWTVPSSIVKNEMLHRIQEDPDYLETHHFKLIKDKKRNREIDGFEIDWWQFDDESDFPFQFVRAAGSGNPLGKVKFMFPNPYAIYMHDTPDKYLFKNRKRAYSHGCIRLHKPQEFLDYVQANFMQNLDENQTEMINSPQTQEIPLDKNIPTFIRYYTAWVENDGTVNFRADVYGYDKIQSQFLK